MVKLDAKDGMFSGYGNGKTPSILIMRVDCEGVFDFKSPEELHTIGTKEHDSGFFSIDFYAPLGFPVRHLLEFPLGMVK